MCSRTLSLRRLYYLVKFRDLEAFHGIPLQAPIIAWDGALWVRVSSAIYNSPEDFEALAEAVVSIRTAAVAPVTSSSTQPPKAPLIGQLQPPSSMKDAQMFQSTDSDTSACAPEVNKSVRDFYGWEPSCLLQTFTAFVPHVD